MDTISQEVIPARVKSRISIAVYSFIRDERFLLPRSVINEIERMLNSFWWPNNSANSRGLARNIFNTPLLASVINDVSTCKLEKDGAYTVRSAYKNIMNHNFPTLQHCVSRNGMFVSLNCNQRLRISCGENVVIVCQQEFGCNQKVFNVLICANCVKGIHPTSQGDLQWHKPSPSRYKCNVDASFSHSFNQVGLRLCIRDDEGRFVLVKTEWLTPLLYVDSEEALGLLSTLHWVRDMRFSIVDFELDIF
ncbi:hypothetical protein MTR_8g038340 [Medicago truncatula]|uniref:RNase H type-1 domain-containing protein n=1 Tax=Medicago truncatula TaxID=3880 RepID=G7LF99_MEDTR|nr:hypothetical protein MTR_8g038340 [Medicago truncatula]